jgi:hypothetical protein
VLKSLGIALLTAAATSGVAQSQQLSASQVAFRHEMPSTTAPAASLPRVASRDSEPSTGGMVAAGILAGAAGLFGGGALGYAMESCGQDEWFCGLAGALIGGTIGSTVMVPLGVHRVGGHANYGAQLGVSLLVAVGSVVAAPITGGISLLVMPVAQIFTSIDMEHRAAARHRGAAR